MKRGEYVPSRVSFPDAPGDPDLPMVDVSLSSPVGEDRAPSPAQAVLDTGSGPTVLSPHLRESLDLVPTGEREVVTFPRDLGEKARTYPVCPVRVGINGAFDEVVEAVVMPLYPDMLLGRDILNKLRITLDAAGSLVTLELGAKAGAP